MKNKLKIVDVSILSTYMGQWLTAFVAIIVFAITASALLSGGGSAQRNIINVCIPAGISAPESKRIYEPFRVALGRETRRPVVLDASSRNWPTHHDVYVMPMSEYLHHAGPLDIVALYEILATPRRSEEAVIIAKKPETDVDFSSVDADEIAFVAPTSVNGFWVQMSLLEQHGFRAPRDAASYRFEGSESGGERVVFAVLFGSTRFGACRLSDVTRLVARGAIQPGELRVVARVVALPELVIAVPHGDEDYYRGKFRSIQAALEEPSTPATEDELVKMLKFAGVQRLEPVDADQIGQARLLRDAVRGLDGAGRTQ